MALLALKQHSLQFVTHRFAAQRVPKSEQLSKIADASFADFKRHNFDAMAKIFAELRNTNIADLLSKIAARTCIIGGINDPVILINETRFLADQIPNAKLIELPNTGHLFYAEAREQVLDSAFQSTIAEI